MEDVYDTRLSTARKLCLLTCANIYNCCTNSWEIYSFPPGGANAVFGDGSVHFLKASMDIRILARLVTRAGGEVVSGDDY
jgi:prepilin-type processing-associated H-X9-DG protein